MNRNILFFTFTFLVFSVIFFGTGFKSAMALPVCDETNVRTCTQDSDGRWYMCTPSGWRDSTARECGVLSRVNAKPLKLCLIDAKSTEKKAMETIQGVYEASIREAKRITTDLSIRKQTRDNAFNTYRNTRIAIEREYKVAVLTCKNNK